MAVLLHDLDIVRHMPKAMHLKKATYVYYTVYHGKEKSQDKNPKTYDP